ncbi:MAG TPA: hypothetical protein VLK33_21250 [Terriglobales bacterium]|nr:hypothetical protein [Terriglobales bacterium]
MIKVHHNLMPKEKCKEYAHLEREVTEILEQLSQLTKTQAEVFPTRNQNEFMRLDKQLELLVGRKERAVGAMRQHAKDHQCWP